jgi:hypothetical protein
MKHAEKKPPPSARRPYAAPKLVVYGHAVTLTQSNKFLGMVDGAKGSLKMRTR